MSIVHISKEDRKLREQFCHEFRTWEGSIRRCHDERSNNWRNYGARGITVCDKWRNSFKAFLDDVGPRPKPKHLYSLDRINKDGNYEPGNVRWTDAKTQANNRRTKNQYTRNTDEPLIDNSYQITYNGETRTIRAWTALCGVPTDILRRRIQNGWTPAKAILTPTLQEKSYWKSVYPEEYNTWCGIRGRCHGANSNKGRSYIEYKSRGIIVCQIWRESFIKFLRDVGPKPQPYHRYSLDRINNDGNYEPGNVRWATHMQQVRNTSYNKLITFNGETHCISEWEEILGNDHIGERLRRGWDLKRAFTEPPGARSKIKKLTFNGKTQTIRQWSKELGISYQAIHYRMEKELPIEEVLATRKSLSDAGKIGGKNRWKAAKKKAITYNGETLSIREWAERVGTTYQTICDRINKGWTIEDVLAPSNQRYVRDMKQILPRR